MRLGWIVYGSIAQLTGGYIYDRLVLDGLRALGAEIDLVSIGRGIDQNALVHRIVGARPDVVVADGLCIPDLAHCLEQLEVACPRLLLVHHLSSWEDRRARHTALLENEARSILACERIVVTSESSATRLRKAYPVASCHVVEPGADRLEVLPRRRSAPEHVNLLFVGQLTERKGLHKLLAATEQLAEPRLHLALVGDASRDVEYASAIERQVRDSSYLSRHVSRLGPLSDIGLAEQLAGADALVAPSSLEGYGMVLTEALHAGLPLIATRTGVTEDLLRLQCQAVLPLECEEVGTIAQALQRFCDDQPLRARMIAGAAQSRRHLPSWALASEAFYANLSGVISERANRRV
jgi:glycosyltransferase involved in cell wall biosynthesis